MFRKSFSLKGTRAKDLESRKQVETRSRVTNTPKEIACRYQLKIVHAEIGTYLRSIGAQDVSGAK
jgi:hypothetical protein